MSLRFNGGGALFVPAVASTRAVSLWVKLDTVQPSAVRYLIDGRSQHPDSFISNLCALAAFPPLCGSLHSHRWWRCHSRAEWRVTDGLG
jgi:hypothetical protein